MYTGQELIDRLTLLFEQFPIKRAALFGSYARGDQTYKSDVDIILELDFSDKGISNFYVFWDKLEMEIKLKADIITFDSLKAAPASFNKRVLNELRYIYEVLRI